MAVPWALDARLALAEADDGSLAAELGEDLRGFGGVHGGHVAAVALAAMQSRVEDADHHPLSVSVTFARTVRPGRVDLRPKVLSAGRTLTAARVELAQDSRLLVSASASFGRSVDSLRRRDRAMPLGVPAPEACEPLGTEPVPGSGGLGIAHRPALGGLPLGGSPHAAGAVWMRLVDDRPVDPLTAVVLADGAVPALYLALDAYEPMPTVELAVHVADLAGAHDSPWLLAHLQNVTAGDGWAIEDLELWAPGGALVAVARQLRHLPGPA